MKGGEERGEGEGLEESRRGEGEGRRILTPKPKIILCGKKNASELTSGFGLKLLTKATIKSATRSNILII